MKASLRAILDEKIDSFIDKACDHEDRPSVGQMYPDMAEHMADAAAAVFDATFAAARYNRDESIT